jgi:hypothetical protein
MHVKSRKGENSLSACFVLLTLYTKGENVHICIHADGIMGDRDGNLRKSACHIHDLAEQELA